MPRKINARELVRDVKNGMQDGALMEKYNLSAKQLGGLYEKLEASGLLPDKQSAATGADVVSAGNAPFVCPACGMPQSKFFEECPQCGVIVAKLLPPSKTRSTDSGASGAIASDPFSMESPHMRPGSRLTLLTCIAAVLLLGTGALIFFLWPRGADLNAATDKRMRDESRSRPSSRERGAHEPMKYIKNLPRVNEINPKVDAEIQRSFRDVDGSLSEGRDGLDRIMKEQ